MAEEKNESGGKIVSFLTFAVVAFIFVGAREIHPGGVFGVIGDLFSNSSESSVGSETAASVDLDKLDRELQSMPLYQILKSEFPKEYNEILDALVAIASDRSIPDEALLEAGAGLMRDFMQKHSEDIASAPDNVIAAVIDSETALLLSLSEKSPEICRAVLMGDFSGVEPNEQERSAVTTVGELRLRAVVVGRDFPVNRPRASEQQWENFSNLTLDSLDEATLKEFESFESLGDLSSTAVCHYGLAAMYVIDNMSDADGAFWYAEMQRDSSR